LKVTNLRAGQELVSSRDVAAARPAHAVTSVVCTAFEQQQRSTAMQPIGMKRFASTHQVGTALVAGLLLSSAVWVAVLGLTGALPDPRRHHAAAAPALAPAGSSSAEQFFQAKLDQLDQVVKRQSASTAHAPSANADRADYLARLGTAQQHRSTNPTDRGARMGGANPNSAASQRSIDDCGWRATECAPLGQAMRHMGGPRGPRFTER
jgi:hypothetical protein